jgi:uncharacterized membrane protein YhhN
MLLLFAVVSRLASVSADTMRQVVAPLGLFLLAFALVAAQSTARSRVIWVIATLAAFSAASWFLMLTRQERDLLTNKFRHDAEPADKFRRR